MHLYLIPLHLVEGRWFGLIQIWDECGTVWSLGYLSLAAQAWMICKGLFARMIERCAVVRWMSSMEIVVIFNTPFTSRVHWSPSFQQDRARGCQSSLKSYLTWVIELLPSRKGSCIEREREYNEDHSGSIDSTLIRVSLSEELVWTMYMLNE